MAAIHNKDDLSCLQAGDVHFQGKEAQATMAYLGNLLREYQPTRNWRPSASTIPATTAFSSHSFPVAAPTLWNKLSVNTRSASTLATFKSWLKTELFTSAYRT